MYPSTFHDHTPLLLVLKWIDFTYPMVDCSLVLSGTQSSTRVSSRRLIDISAPTPPPPPPPLPTTVRAFSFISGISTLSGLCPVQRT